MNMQNHAQPTVPGTGIYAGKLYTEEERAEIKRRNCLTHGQRMQEAHADHQLGFGISVLIFILPIVLCVLGTIAEFALLH